MPTWRDPTADLPGSDLVNLSGFRTELTRIDNKMSVCQRHLPAGIGIPLSVRLRVNEPSTPACRSPPLPGLSSRP
jgi:hypothetical protein